MGKGEGGEDLHVSHLNGCGLVEEEAYVPGTSTIRVENMIVLANSQTAC